MRCGALCCEVGRGASPVHVCAVSCSLSLSLSFDGERASQLACGVTRIRTRDYGFQSSHFLTLALSAGEGLDPPHENHCRSDQLEDPGWHFIRVPLQGNVCERPSLVRKQRLGLSPSNRKYRLDATLVVLREATCRSLYMLWTTGCRGTKLCYHRLVETVVRRVQTPIETMERGFSRRQGVLFQGLRRCFLSFSRFCNLCYSALC